MPRRSGWFYAQLGFTVPLNHAPRWRGTLAVGTDQRSHRGLKTQTASDELLALQIPRDHRARGRPVLVARRLPRQRLH